MNKLVTKRRHLDVILLCLSQKYDPKVLTVVEISALKVRVFGKKCQKPHAKPHANLR